MEQSSKFEFSLTLLYCQPSCALITLHLWDICIWVESLDTCSVCGRPYQHTLSV